MMLLAPGRTFDMDEGSVPAALHANDPLDIVPEADYDALVGLTAQLLGKQIAFLSLVDCDRWWIEARTEFGLIDPSMLNRFVDDTIGGDDMTIVEDAALDRRFGPDPSTSGGVRFYAGIPLYAPGPDGMPHPVGALCVADPHPARLAPAEITAFRNLAKLAQSLLGARVAARAALTVASLAERQAADLLRKEETSRHAERIANIGSWRYLPRTGELRSSEGVLRIHGLAAGDQAIERLLDRYTAPTRKLIRRAARASLKTGAPFDIEVDCVDTGGNRRRVRVAGVPETGSGKVTALYGLVQDITDWHRLEERLRRSADRDDLTGLANRAAFERKLGIAVARTLAERKPLMIAIVDLDGFKDVNDTLGHLAGDDVLRAVGRRLRDPWLQGSYAARLGGDEFVLIVDHPLLVADPEAFANRLQDELCVPVTAGRMTIGTSGTVGAAMLADHDNIRDFVHAADTELYAAKRRRIGNRRRTDRHGGPPKRMVAAE